jgi:hypothetical protein
MVLHGDILLLPLGQFNPRTLALQHIIHLALELARTTRALLVFMTTHTPYRTRIR